MRKKTKRNIYISAIIIAVISILITAFMFSVIGRVMTNEKANYIYIDKDDNIDSVRNKIVDVGSPTSMKGFDLLNHLTEYEKNIHIGRYELSSTLSMFNLFRNLRNGQQSPSKVVIPSVRTVEDVCDKITKGLMISSQELLNTLYDSLNILGFTKETLPALFIPNTYEIYWTTEAGKLTERLKSEYDRFWNSERKLKAEQLGLSPIEVTTLASIVDSETSRDQDKPIIARLYLNRLKKHMRLASDPTVVFAVGDFTLRRVLKRHLEIDSPYNTYKYEGLPPGPIRITSIAGIDAVLNPDDNDFLYMCAKEDFSGEHYYTASETEHMNNARKYAEALNQRKIK